MIQMKRHLCILMILFLFSTIHGIADSKGTRIPYPGGKCFIYRYTLKDKQGSTYRLTHPTRWLSQKAVERRKRQGLALDTTDLPVSPKYIKQFESRQAQVIGTSRWLNTVLVRSADTTLLNRLSTLPCVEKAKCVWTAPDSIERGPVKTLYHEHFTHLDSTANEYYGAAKEQIESLRGQRLHDIDLRGQGMTIAVLDGGFQNVDRIPCFHNANIAGWHDFVFPNSPSIFHETDHGTKVLSTMAMNSQQVLVGTAPEARYWLLRCEDQQSEQEVEEDYWTMAAEFADSLGADIVNSSLGYNEFDHHHHDHKLQELDGRTAFISRAASMLAQKGIILVNSAGNSGMGPWKKINFPADAVDILSVGAMTHEQKNASFSSVGPTQDGRVKPDLLAQGSPAAVISGRGIVTRDMGTSFSTPIVAGLVACLWQGLREATALDIIRLVRESCNNYAQPDNIYGYGVPNFWRAYMVGKRMRNEK